MTRVLIAARLSKQRDVSEASRIELDDLRAREWAEANDRTVVATSVDRKVSGKVHPFERKGLGPWLTDPVRMAQYDEIVASTIDRLGRDSYALSDLRRWAEDNGKRITVLSPELHWPPAPGDTGTQFVWSTLGEVADAELKAITKRYADVRTAIGANGGLYGRAPFGFRVTGPKYSKTIEPDPRLVPHVREMVKRALRNDTLLSIAQYLDANGVLPVRQRPDDDTVIGTVPDGSGWSPRVVSQALRMPALKGRHEFQLNGRTMRLKHEAILTVAEWNELQTALRRGHRGPVVANDSVLSGSIVCGVCGQTMFRHLSQRTRKDGTVHIVRYYRCMGPDKCRTKCRNMIRQADTDAWVDRILTDEGMPFAQIQIVETRTVPGDDHAAEIAEVQAEIRELDSTDPAYLAKVGDLVAEQNRLLALPSEPSQVIERPTGKTVCEVWAKLTDSGKRAYLLAAGLRVRVRPDPMEDVWQEEWGEPPPSRYRVGKHEVGIDGWDPARVVGTLQSITAA